ncbi:serine protease inhibitor 28Dc-like [Anopheles cruzii]|uniref:serine protease inhibitor 28Dc-like n=1 Tax=Anopheles cruzii TaxID=68878 RepID=UPI0022EC52E8|nr:serine protease inhibitor 28Dc-like [Anopheles cruzii]
MKSYQPVSFTLCLLLVALADGQWSRRYTTSYTPLVRKTTRNFASRLGVDTGPTTVAPVRTAKPRTSFAQPPQNDPRVAQSVVDFMIRLSNTMVQQQSKAELFSPLSVSMVAHLLYLGSKGATHAEFSKVLIPPGMEWKQLHRSYGGVLANLMSPTPIDALQEPWRRQTCPKEDDYDDADERSTPAPKSQINRVANGIFYQTGLPIHQQYVRLAREIYGALVHPLDLNADDAPATINQWVSHMTAGKINKMIEGPLGGNSGMVVANALYFKAKWRNQFDGLSTRDGPFFPDGFDGPSYRVKLMTLSACLPFHRTRDAADVTILGLPYRDDTTTMYLIQPANSSRAAIRRLQATLNGKTLDTLIGRMKLQKTSVRLPKMHLRSSVDLTQSFQRLGFNSIFSPAKSDLTNMFPASNGGQKPYVNQIIHKLDLSVDEEGTEGAAATAALIDRIGSPAFFNGNTPFLLYVRHDSTGLPLFYGPVFDPR